jgi:hypothetical protein
MPITPPLSEAVLSRVLRLSLTGLALLFWGAALGAVLGQGIQISLGPVRISVQDASRAAFQAALVTAAALVCWRVSARRPFAVVATVAVVIVTGVMDSTPRRVGDGTEYMAMTLHMADGHGPSFNEAALQQSTSRLESLGWLDGTSLTGLITTADGRWEFQHFWLYSALVAPFASAMSVVGAHPNVAFTVVNAAMLLALVWLLCTRGDYLLALVVGIGPIVWWVDKAHSEVFMVSAIGAACLLADEHRRWGFWAAAIAAAQNPAALGPLVVRASSLSASRNASRGDYVALAGGVAIATIYPAYYLLRTGRLSPLLHPEGPHWPGLRALLTPFIDPNVGLLPFAPIYCMLVAAGFIAQSARTRLVTLSTLGLLLLAAAQAGNVNHGGTPGMSRYALWLFAAGLPAAAVSARRLQDLAPAAVVVIGTTAALTWGSFRPALTESHSLRPTALAESLWSGWPGLDNPLPEVFAERTSGRDGDSPVPATDARCGKVLTVGTGSEALFPFPCEPAPAPPACTAAGALCYVNAEAFTPAPPQRGFAGRAIPERSWTVSTRQVLADVGTALGDDLRTERLGRARDVVTGTGIDYLWIVEGRRGTAVWVYPLAGRIPELTIRFDSNATVTVQDAESRAELQRAALPSGEHQLRLSAETPALVLVTMPDGGASGAAAMQPSASSPPGPKQRPTTGR